MILKLLVKKPSLRLGSKADAADLKAHKFFAAINWDQLAEKKYEAPWLPNIKDLDDVSQFSDEFTNQVPEDEPAEPLRAPEKFKIFRGKS